MSWGEPSYDQHAFASHRVKAVAATPTAHEGWNTTGISFADFSNGMHVHRRKHTQERRLPCPPWSQNDVETRAAVLHYCEGYLNLRDHSGDDATRMQRIRDRVKVVLPMRERHLEIMLKQYHEHGAQPGTRDFAVQVQNRDRQVFILRKGLPEVITAVVYLYYRLGWNSVAVAEQLGLTSCGVREILWRLNKRMKGEKVPFGKLRLPTTPWPKEMARKLFVSRLLGRSFTELTEEFGCSASSLMARWKAEFGPLNVRQIKRNALRPRKHSGRWTDEALRRLFVMRACGLSFSQCAKRFGRHPSGVKRVWQVHFGDLKLVCGRRGVPIVGSH
jgi:hypothetical protein